MSNTNWTNADGLFIRYGTLEAVPAKQGEYSRLGPRHEIEADILWSDLAAFGTTSIIGNDVAVPKGAQIEAVVLTVETAFVGSTATLSLGLIQPDRVTTTGVGSTVLVNAAAVSTLTLGAVLTITAGSTAVGAAVGAAAQTVNGLLTATVGTANFTAGRLKARIYYVIP